MVRFIQAQKDEFDKLYQKKNELSAYDVIWEVQKHENDYPLLYVLLFGSEDNCSNQDEFTKIWIDPTKLLVIETQFYLLMFGAMYIALDDKQDVQYTPKNSVPDDYKIKFTQLEVDSLQERPEFKNRIDLNSFKIEVNSNTQ